MILVLTPSDICRRDDNGRSRENGLPSVPRSLWIADRSSEREVPVHIRCIKPGAEGFLKVWVITEVRLAGAMGREYQLVLGVSGPRTTGKYSYSILVL